MLCHYVKQQKHSTKDTENRRVELCRHRKLQPGQGLVPAQPQGLRSGFLPALPFPDLLQNRESKRMPPKAALTSLPGLLPRPGLTWWEFDWGRWWPCPPPREWVTSFWKLLEYSDPSVTPERGLFQEAKQAAQTQVIPKVMRKVIYWIKENFKLSV